MNVRLSTIMNSLSPFLYSHIAKYLTLGDLVSFAITNKKNYENLKDEIKARQTRLLERVKGRINDSGVIVSYNVFSMKDEIVARILAGDTSTLDLLLHYTPHLDVGTESGFYQPGGNKANLFTVATHERSLKTLRHLLANHTGGMCKYTFNEEIIRLAVRENITAMHLYYKAGFRCRGKIRNKDAVYLMMQLGIYEKPSKRRKLFE